MAIQVIGAGLGRTGTLSLKAALEELGFGKCYHMVEVIKRRDDALVWDAAARGEAVDWEEFLKDYHAVVDWPACSFYRALLEHYPEAKVVLTVRDPQRWHQSARETIHQVRRAYPKWALAFVPGMRHFFRMIDRIIWDGTFQGRFEDADFAVAVFNQHNEEVRANVPPERLLVYEVKDGWAPLCAFLGVPVPKEKPFPHLNDTAEFRKQVRRIARAVRGATFGAVALVIIVLVWIATRWFH